MEQLDLAALLQKSYAICDALMDARLQFSAWVIEDKGGAELIDAASVFIMVAHVGMITG